MRKIIVSEFVSLDGMMSDPGDTMKWVTDDFSESEGAYEVALYDRIDTLMLGRTTYEIWRGYWPKALTDPGTDDGNREMAKTIDAKSKILVSSKSGLAYWGSGATTQLQELDRETILGIKRKPGKDIAVIGSASVVQQLTALGLVDEYHLLIHPLIMGKGKPLFDSGAASTTLALKRTEDFGNGVVLHEYQRRG